MADAARPMRSRKIHALVLRPLPAAGRRRSRAQVWRRRRGVSWPEMRCRSRCCRVVRRTPSEPIMTWRSLLSSAPIFCSSSGMSTPQMISRALVAAPTAIGSERSPCCAEQGRCRRAPRRSRHDRLSRLGQSKVAQETLRGVHLFDTEDDSVDSADVHDCSPCERLCSKRVGQVART